MTKTVTLSFDKSQNDIPVLVISTKSASLFPADVNIKNRESNNRK